MTAGPHIAAVLLAAGASSRLGRPKQTLVFHGERLLDRAIRIAFEAGMATVLVVLNDAELMPSVNDMGGIGVLNLHAHLGLASSIRIGIERMQGANVSGAILMTCDQPALEPAHLRALAADPDSSAGSFYAGRIGVPAYFPVTMFPQLLALEGDTGARALLQGARFIAAEELALDIDTEADLAVARKRLARG